MNKKEINTLLTYFIIEINWKLLGNSYEYSSYDVPKQHGYFMTWGIQKVLTLLVYNSILYFIGLCIIYEKIKEDTKKENSNYS